MSDWLDDALKDSQGYLPDDGFTARVVAALPARGASAGQRFVVLGACAIGALVAGFLSGSEFVARIVLQLVTAKSLSPSLIGPAILVALGLGACLWPVASEN